LAALINLLLVEILLREILAGEFLQGTAFKRFTFFALPAISALLWWALERRLSRLRKRKRDQSGPDDSDGSQGGVAVDREAPADRQTLRTALAERSRLGRGNPATA